VESLSEVIVLPDYLNPKADLQKETKETKEGQCQSIVIFKSSFVIFATFCQSIPDL
jgi:hypothetical protein